MITAGIIAEYNPFHNGHAYQIEYTRKNYNADYIIVAMSGDFVQRGTPALIPKHIRAEMALKCGADLVLELPVSVSTASAEFFSYGGVNLFHKLGVVDKLCFGSEEGFIDCLSSLADILISEPEFYRIKLKEGLSQGKTFPLARNYALVQYLSKESSFMVSPEDADRILSSPNNILGIEYCKAIKRLGSNISPVTITRMGSGYHEKNLSENIFPSATAIRNAAESPVFFNDIEKIFSQQIPKEGCDIFLQALKNKMTVNAKDFSLLLHYRLLSETAESLMQYLDISSDLARRIINQRNNYKDFSQFVSLLKTRELTQTRIQRGLLHILLDIKKPVQDIPYARVLGFKKSSSLLLKEIKKHSSIPLVTKLSDHVKKAAPDTLEIINKNTIASNIYESVLCHKTNKNFIHEYEKPVVIL